MKSTPEKYTLLNELYPQYDKEELQEAEAALKNYLTLVWRIYQRVRLENPKKLTEILLNARFKRARS